MLLPISDSARSFLSTLIFSVLIRAAAWVVSTQMNMLGIWVLRHFLLQIYLVPLIVRAILLLVCSFVMFATSMVGMWRFLFSGFTFSIHVPNRPYLRGPVGFVL